LEKGKGSVMCLSEGGYVHFPFHYTVIWRWKINLGA